MLMSPSSTLNFEQTCQMSCLFRDPFLKYNTNMHVGSSGRTENVSNLAIFKNLLKIINLTRKKIQKCLSKFISQVLALTRELLFYNLWNIDVIIFYTHNFEQIHVNSVIRFWNITQTCMSGGSAKRSNLRFLKICYSAMHVLLGLS